MKRYIPYSPTSRPTSRVWAAQQTANISTVIEKKMEIKNINQSIKIQYGVWTVIINNKKCELYLSDQ